MTPQTQAKHTPGPWTLNGTWSDGTLTINGSVGGNVADIHFADEEDYANGRLIAAAPDLLEACRFVVDWVNEFLPHQGAAENCLLEHVQAAIAKAEGRQ